MQLLKLIQLLEENTRERGRGTAPEPRRARWVGQDGQLQLYGGGTQAQNREHPLWAGTQVHPTPLRAGLLEYQTHVHHHLPARFRRAEMDLAPVAGATLASKWWPSVGS